MRTGIDPVVDPAIDPAIDPSIDIEKIRLSWDVVLEKVKQRKITARAMLLPAMPVAWRGGELVLEFDEKSRYHRDSMSDPTRQGPLVEAFHETFGVRPRIACVVRQGERSVRPPPEPARAPARSATPAPVATSALDEEEIDLDDEPGTPVEPARGQGHAGAVDLVREGFGAEIVDEF